MKIDTEKNTVYNCDAARPQSIDFNWLDNNPGQLFNNVLTVDERNMMLLNQRNSSCENNCFRAEDVGAISPRIIRKGYIKSHTESIAEVKILDLTIGSDCNLTCTYCLKEYSSAWRKDLEQNGNYPIMLDDDRYELNYKDIVAGKLSQIEKYNKKTSQQILKEIEILSLSASELLITGGEPFLNNKLFDILDKVKHVPKINIFSGLGVSFSRLEKILNNLKDFKNINLILSCENIGSYLEFNRYGNTWVDYEKKINLIIENYDHTSQQ
jgi:organic radical activating enzyme